MDALQLRYQTCIIDRFPFVDYPNSPLSNTTAVFCQPNGAQILEKAFMPTFLSFVLTDSEGEKMYAVTVTFCDEMSQEMLDKLKRTIETIYVCFCCHLLFLSNCLFCCVFFILLFFVVLLLC